MKALLLLAIALPLMGQETVDSSNAEKTIPYKMRYLEPGRCSVGELYGNLTTGAFRRCTAPNTWTDIGTGGGGGSGSVTLTTGTGTPVANCTAPSTSNLAVYLDTTNQDQWWCSATNTWKKILSVTASGPYGVTGTTTIAPSAPAAGSVSCYFDSTTNTQVCIDSSNNAFSMVKGLSAVTHQFVTNVDASGIQHQAQPAFTDLSGTAAAAQIPATPLPTPGTAITLVAPRGYAICTGTCTVTVPVPVAGYEFCIINDDNVATAITLSALGSSARYEGTARTAYGTAGTGTFTATAAAGNKVCLVGRDATHYLTLSFVGTWTAN